MANRFTPGMRARVAAMLVLLLAVGSTLGASPPRRIVTLAPSLTETVFALGGGPRVVGVGDYAAFPPQVARLPHLGGLYNTNIERILALRPDLVLIPSPVPRLQTVCRDAGIRTEIVRMDGVSDLEAAIGRIGKLLGRRAAAREVIGRLNRQLESVSVATRTLPHPRVLLVIDRPMTGPLRDVTVVGHGSFLDVLLRAAGGRNVFANIHRRYFTASLEAILRRRPGMILELDADAPHPGRLRDEAQRAWSKLFGPGHTPPVRVVTDPIFVVPGPRAGIAAEKLAAILHPGLGGSNGVAP
ncbi:MAG: ABC transporter substrate-binding protein [Acidobacteria bacterium]|nr:ABC transporter substrate-binding protein [Acidobacteriota bacterium]